MRENLPCPAGDVPLPRSASAPSSALQTCAEALGSLTDGQMAAWLVAGWLQEYESPNTRAAYARDVRDFARWLAPLGMGLLEVDRVVVATYADHLQQGLGRRPGTVRRHLGTVSSFFTYAVQAGAVGRNPVEPVRRPHGVPTLTPALGAQDATRLVTAARRAGPRDTVLLALLLGAGLRVSEALAIDVEDLQQVRGHLTVVIRGKGGREDRITLSHLARDAVDALVVDPPRTAGPLLLGATGGRLTRNGANAALLRLSRAAGLPPVRPHTLRATAITLALEADVPLRDVQDFARHADPRTTRRYDRAARGLDRHAATSATILAVLDRVTSSVLE